MGAPVSLHNGRTLGQLPPLFLRLLLHQVHHPSRTLLNSKAGRNKVTHKYLLGGNSKPGSGQHGQQIPTGNQSPSSPVVVGSPPTSVSKSAGGSPRASSTGSKVGSTPSLSSQQAKNTSSGPSRKSSPVGGRNAPSNLGNSHVNPAQCSATKSQSHHHQQQQQQQQQQKHLQQQQQKQNLQQGQLLFSNMYMQAQSPQSTSNTSNTSGTPNIGYYQQRRQPAEQQQQQPGSSNTVSSGMLTLSPSLTLAGATNDPTKAAHAAAAAAAAAANMKGGLPPPGLLQAAQYATQTGGHQFMSAAFPYLHSVPGVQVKPSEQKQPAGNDNLRASWQPEKR